MIKESQERIMKKQEEIATCLFLTGDPNITDITVARKILHDQVVESLKGDNDGRVI